MDGNPDVGSGIGNLVIDMCINEEIIGFSITVLDVVDTGLADAGEVKLYIVVFEIGPPRFDISFVDFLSLAVVLDAEERGSGFHRVMLIEFDDGYFRLLWRIAYL